MAMANRAQTDFSHLCAPLASSLHVDSLISVQSLCVITLCSAIQPVNKYLLFFSSESKIALILMKGYNEMENQCQ